MGNFGLACFSILLVTTVGATTFRKNYRNTYDEGGEAYSSYDSSYRSGTSRNSPQDFTSSYDGDDYIPPIGVQHNNDYSGLGDGYRDYTGGNGGSGAISYSHVVTEHRPVQRTVVPSSLRGLKAESTNIVERPVPFPLKVPISVDFDRSILPVVPIARVAPALIAPVKYPTIHFFKPFSYPSPGQQFNAQVPQKNSQPEYVLTKVPLVYHATYSESPLSASGIQYPNPHFTDINNYGSSFNHGAVPFNHRANSLNKNFNRGSNFNHGNTFNINPTITTPGTPSHSFNFPTPIAPTPTPYHGRH